MNNPNPQQPQPPRVSPTTCIVGCKLPHGLQCELRSEDGKKVVAKFTMKGTNDARIVGGYGLTDGVPTEFMVEWLKRNSEHPAVVSGAIFMHDNVKGAESRAKEFRKLTTGMEAIDPLKDNKKHGLVIDKEAEAAYRKQVAENPARNRQQIE